MPQADVPVIVRDANGHFLPGTIPPRPPKGVPKSVQPYLRATLQACSVEEWQEVVRVAFEDATKGEDKVRGQAREFLRKAIFGDTPAVQLIQLLAAEGSTVGVGIGSRSDQELLDLLRSLVDFKERGEPESLPRVA